ncbi:MAG: type II toxin-antitoxin system PemK/MazF family toxin [Geothrix sp.]|nr:type II toxin-antitoxin system PemK/MazF family toxin [Geothrix sp.]
MIGFRVPDRGDVYWFTPDEVAGKEMKGHHAYLVLSPKSLNQYGISVTVAITTGGAGPRESGVTVPLTGTKTGGVVVCHQIRSLDLQARGAEYSETLDKGTVQLVADTIASIIGA